MGAGPCFGFLEPVRGPPKLTTGYGSFRGLGAPMRMMCEYVAVPTTDIKYSAVQTASGSWSSPEWMKHKRELAVTNPLVRLPYVINHGTGEVVAQSNAVYLYLGRLLKLSGRSRDESAANEQVLFHLHVMWTQLRDLVYPDPAAKNADALAFRSHLADHLKVTVPEHYDKLEAWLKQKNTPFFVTNAPCTADFHVWEFLDQQELMASRHCYDSPMDGYPLLQAFYARFRALPALQRYFDGEDYRLPLNNQMAYFY